MKRQIRPPQLQATHVQGTAIGYMRQSTRQQASQNVGSIASRRSLAAEYLRLLDWPESTIKPVDEEAGANG